METFNTYWFWLGFLVGLSTGLFTAFTILTIMAMREEAKNAIEDAAKETAEEMEGESK